MTSLQGRNVYTTHIKTFFRISKNRVQVQNEEAFYFFWRVAQAKGELAGALHPIRAWNQKKEENKSDNEGKETSG